MGSKMGEKCERAPKVRVMRAFPRGPLLMTYPDEYP
jgi:hypothetical protein